MRDIVEMKRIDDHMRHYGDVIEIRRHANGHEYYLDGCWLPGQVVRDMISDGWIIEGDSSLYRA